MKKIILNVSILFLLFFISCVDARRAKIGGYGDKFKIELINCDGSVARTWISSGKVLSEETSDGYYFNEEASGKLIEVTGNLIITKQ